MAFQARQDYDITPILRFGEALIKDNETFTQDVGRSGDLATYTVLSRDPANDQLEVLDLAATDGTEIPAGLSAQSATEADIQAGNITGFQLYIKTGRIDEAAIVVEGSTLDAEITNQNQTVRDMLIKMDIIPEPGQDMDRYENS